MEAQPIRCPCCGDFAPRHDLGGLSFDVCKGCGGIWFGANQLKHLVQQGPQALDDLMKFEPVESHETRPLSQMKCPECHIPLHANRLAGAGDVVACTCYQCGGMFLDAEGLHKLDDRSHHPDAPPAPISEEAKLLAGQLAGLTAMEQERTQLFYSQLRYREQYRYWTRPLWDVGGL